MYILLLNHDISDKFILILICKKKKVNQKEIANPNFHEPNDCHSWHSLNTA